MFRLNNKSVDNEHMGLQYATVDLMTLSTEGRGEDYRPSYHERLLFNTSGKTTGIKELIEFKIKEFLGQKVNKKLRLTVEDVFDKIIDKAMEMGDYNPDKNNNIAAYCMTIVEFAFKEIRRDRQLFTATDFTTESDKGDGEGDAKITTEELMAKQGRIHIEDNLLDDEARQMLVHSLEAILIAMEDDFTTKESQINTFRYLQGRYALFVVSEVEQQAIADYGKDNLGNQVLRASKIKKINTTLGVIDRSNIANQIYKKLLEDDLRNNRLRNAFSAFMRACNHLEIPFMELDAEEILTREYIKKLKYALNYKRTICVSEYDLAEVPQVYTESEIKEKYIHAALTAQGMDRKDISHQFTTDLLSKISRVKITDLRRLNSITKKVELEHNNFVKNSKFAEMKAKEKHVKNMVKHTSAYKTNMRIRNSILMKDSRYNGPLTVPVLEIIKEVTSEYFKKLSLADPVRFNKLLTEVGKDINHRKQILGVPLQTGITTDNNGFLMVEGTTEYYIHNEQKPFRVKKDYEFKGWLVNINGYLVSRYVDMVVEQGKKPVIIKAGKKRQLDDLIIKPYDGKGIILEGYEDFVFRVTQ